MESLLSDLRAVRESQYAELLNRPGTVATLRGHQAPQSRLRRELYKKADRARRLFCIQLGRNYASLAERFQVDREFQASQVAMDLTLQDMQYGDEQFLAGVRENAAPLTRDQRIAKGFTTLDTPGAQTRNAAPSLSRLAAGAAPSSGRMASHPPPKAGDQPRETSASSSSAAAAAPAVPSGRRAPDNRAQWRPPPVQWRWPRPDENWEWYWNYNINQWSTRQRW